VLDYQNSYQYNDEGQLTTIIQSSASTSGDVVAEKEIDIS
jgi:hypothetical protein